MKTIALIGTYDTKNDELMFIKDKLEGEGVKSILIDVSTMPGYVSNADFTPAMVFAAANNDIEQVHKMKKYEMLHEAAVGAATLVNQLYQEGKIQGAMSIGGLQNSNIGCHAMQVLPVGIPKLMVSTVACGQRVFEPMSGTKDITIMPAVSDFTGVNVVSKAVLSNAVSALAGMLKNAGKTIEKKEGIGVTFMGATNDGAVNAIEFLKQAGREVIAFHSTGTGGRSMEELIEQGIITATLDMTLHEVVYEHFGYGFGYGANNRLAMGVEKQIPMVICPGGVDFMCQWKWQLFDDIDSRVYNWHNETLAHVKLTPKEATDVSNIIIRRLNEAKGPVVVIMPLQGFRSLSKKGQELYAPDVDQAIIDAFDRGLRKDIPIKYFDANFCDIEFSRFAADEMLNLLEDVYEKR